MSWIALYDNKILPNLSSHIPEIFADCKPIEKGSHYVCTCPECDKAEAYIYKNSDRLECNRKNECGYHINVISYLNGGAYPKGKDYVDIIKRLCEMTGTPFPERKYSREEIQKIEEHEQKQKLLNDFQHIVSKALLDVNYGARAQTYLENRGFPKDSLLNFEFGFYPSRRYVKEKLTKLNHLPSDIEKSGIFRDDWEGRITYPIKYRRKTGDYWARDITGNVDSSIKYLRMSKRSGSDPSILFGLDNCSYNEIIVVEGYFDAFSLWANGIKNVVALASNKLTNDHIKKLEQSKIKTITLLLDNDNAGIEGVENTIRNLKNHDIMVYVIPPELLKNCKDADKYIKEHGKEALKSLFDNRIDGFRYLAQAITKKCKVGDERKDNELAAALDNASKFEKSVTNPNRLLSMDFFWEEFINRTGVDQDTVDGCRQSLQEKKYNSAIKQSLQESTMLFEQGKHDAAREVILETAANIKASQNTTKVLQVQFINEFKENFLLTDAPPMPSLITMLHNEKNIPFIPRGIVGSIVGAGGIGKTHWLTQLALSIVMNEPFLGHYSIKEIGHVALILGENSHEDIHRLLRKTIKGIFGGKLRDAEQRIKDASSKLAVMSVMGTNASFIDRNLKTTPFFEKFLNNLIKIEPEEGFSCVILDPASRFMGPTAEVDNAAATSFVSLLERITQELKGKPTVLFGHHMNKSAVGVSDTKSSASRGSSGLTDGVRWQLNLEPTGENGSIKMNVTKTNHTMYPPAQILRKKLNGHLVVATEEEKKAIDGRKDQQPKKDGKRKHDTYQVNTSSVMKDPQVNYQSKEDDDNVPNFGVNAQRHQQKSFTSRR